MASEEGGKTVVRRRPMHQDGRRSATRSMKCALFTIFENVDTYVFRHRIGRFCGWAAFGRFDHCDNEDGRYDDQKEGGGETKDADQGQASGEGQTEAQDKVS